MTESVHLTTGINGYRTNGNGDIGIISVHAVISSTSVSTTIPHTIVAICTETQINRSTAGSCSFNGQTNTLIIRSVIVSVISLIDTTNTHVTTNGYFSSAGTCSHSTNHGQGQSSRNIFFHLSFLLKE